MGITRSPLPYKYGNLPLHSNWGNFMVILHGLIIKNYPDFLKLLP